MRWLPGNGAGSGDGSEPVILEGRTLMEAHRFADNRHVSQDMSTVPKIASVGATISGGVLFLSALFGVYLSLAATEQPLWGSLSFEFTLVITGLLVVLLGLGRFAPGFGMAAGVLGMTAIGAIVLGYVDAKSNLAQTWVGPHLKQVVGVRVLLAFTLLACGGFATLQSERHNYRRFFLGLMFLAPVAALGLAAKIGRLGFLTSKAEGNAELLRVGGLFMIGVILIVLLSASGHLLITAFLPPRGQANPDRA